MRGLDPDQMVTLPHGFEWGGIEVTRLASDKKAGWVYLGVNTAQRNLEFYATRTGKLRLYERTAAGMVELSLAPLAEPGRAPEFPTGAATPPAPKARVAIVAWLDARTFALHTDDDVAKVLAHFGHVRTEVPGMAFTWMIDARFDVWEVISFMAATWVTTLDLYTGGNEAAGDTAVLRRIVSEATDLGGAP